MDLIDDLRIAAIAAQRGRGSIRHRPYRSAPYRYVPRSRGIYRSWPPHSRPYRNLSLVNSRRPTASDNDDGTSAEPTVSSNTWHSSCEHSMRLLNNIVYEHPVVGQDSSNDTADSSRTLSGGIFSLLHPNNHVAETVQQDSHHSTAFKPYHNRSMPLVSWSKKSITTSDFLSRAKPSLCQYFCRTGNLFSALILHPYGWGIASHTRHPY
jgi:hypothetical protein